MNNPSGLCKCGCGCKTRLATENSTAKGWTKGEPLRWIAGHQRRPVMNYLPSNSPEYRIWKQMLDRCTNPGNKRYHDYGGRGITVAEELLTLSGFIAVLGMRPSPKLTLERVNNDGNYERGNIKWATRFEQARNKRNNKLDEMKVTKIRELHAHGLRASVIGPMFNVTKRHVNHIIQGRWWAE